MSDGIFYRQTFFMSYLLFNQKASVVKSRYGKFRPR